MFADKLKNTLNYETTENGAIGFSTTNSALLDMNFKISSYRNKSDDEIIADFTKCWNENKELALKFLFYIRDIRGGIGERRLFRVAIASIADELPLADNVIFKWVMEYGRADDLFAFVGTHLESSMLYFIKLQLDNDLKLDNNCSLLAKWLPSENTSSEKTKKLAKKVRNYLGLSSKQYRQMLSKIRKHLDVVERKMCKKEWNGINYEAVPSRANLIYNNAFLRNDETRRREYLEKLEKGEAKINSSVLFPHDIVHKYNLNTKDIALENMWKGLPDYVKGNSNILVVRDGSGSMGCHIGNSNITALDVSTALAIYFSERQSGQFKNKFITFSARPRYVDLSAYNYPLKEKIRICNSHTDCSNTDIRLTLQLILKTAIDNKLKQEEIPNLLIISDMEFDGACQEDLDNKLFNIISNEWKTAGYQLPKLIFWNVNSRTNTIPVIQNDFGVILVSGFSPAVVNMVLSNELNPYKALEKVLLSERYAKIKL